MIGDIKERYGRYARSQGRNPEDQLTYDSETFPAAPMLPYVLWVNDQITQYYVRMGIRKRPLTTQEKRDLDHFIEKRILQEQEKSRILVEKRVRRRRIKTKIKRLLMLDLLRLLDDCVVPTLDNKDIKFQAPFYMTLCKDYLFVPYKSLSADARIILRKHLKDIYFGHRRVLENRHFYINYKKEN